MAFLRIVLAFLFVTWSVFCLVLAGLAVLWTEAGMVRLNVPQVSGLGVYADSVKLEIYDRYENLMYRKDYFYGGRINQTDDLTLAGHLIELVREDSTEPLWWEKIFLRLEGIEPQTLESFVADYYARNLVSVSRVTGIRKDILRWYTLQNLRGTYTTRELYALFLDSVHYATNIHGIVGAAEAYFGKQFNELTPLETAYLVVMVTTTPATQDPDELIGEYDKKARQFMYDLYRNGIFTMEQYRHEINERLVFYKPNYPNIEPTITARVLASWNKPIDKTTIIHTHYDPIATAVAIKALNTMFRQDPKMQGVFVMVNVETGGIEVAVGSKVPNSSHNRAFSSKRQMGSTFKPIVYAAAFQRKYLPSARVVDKQYDFKDGDNIYSPNNYESVFMGNILLRYGLIHSLNNTTVMLAQQVGLRRVHQMAVNMGFEGYIRPYFSTALGTFPTTPLNVAEIYATLANFGETKELSFIKDVEYGGGMTHVERKPSKRAMDPVSAYQTMYIMQDIPRIGTARRARLLPGTAAKTGTSDQSRDVWTAAIVYPYVIVVWMGYDSFEPMDEKRSGGNTAAPVIAAFQREYFEKDAVFHIPPPDGVVFVPVRVRDGVISEKGGRGTYIEALRVLGAPAD